MTIAFPASPSVGQVYQQWIWNGTAWVALGGMQGAPLNVQVFTASGTYTPSVGMTSCMVECVGGGGGGGNAPSGQTGYVTSAAGGGGGGYARKFLTAAQVGASQVVTIGAGGAGAATGAGFLNGTGGGSTSFGSLCVAGGGNPNNGSGGGAGGTSPTGDVLATGSGGVGATQASTTSGVSAWVGGVGGSSALGGGGTTPSPGASSGRAGSPGGNFGGGGSGADVNNVGTSYAGGAGAPGVCIVTEYNSTGASVGPTFVPDNYLTGFTFSNDATTPNTVVDIAAGLCSDSTNTTTIRGTAFTKTSAIWAAGSGNGGFALAVVASTWYHAFAAIINGAYDVFFDTSLTAAHAPAGTTAFRRIFSFNTLASTAYIRPMAQYGDYFAFLNPQYDVSGAFNSPGQGINILVPPNLVVTANLVWSAQNSSTTSPTNFYMWDGRIGTTRPAALTPLTANQYNVSASAFVLCGSIVMGTSGGTPNQVMVANVGSTLTNLQIETIGYWDTRGR